MPIRRPIPTGDARWPDHADREPFAAGEGRVTVIVPTRDRPELCRRALESLQAQTFQDWDGWVVLNGPAGNAPAYQLELADLVAGDDRFIVLDRPALAGIAGPIN